MDPEGKKMKQTALRGSQLYKHNKEIYTRPIYSQRNMIEMAQMLGWSYYYTCIKHTCMHSLEYPHVYLDSVVKRWKERERWPW